MVSTGYAYALTVLSAAYGADPDLFGYPDDEAW